MGSRPEPIPLRRTKGPKRQFIGLDGVGWANVTTLIVSPKLVRLLVIRGKYLITSGLPLPACFTETRSHGGSPAGRDVPVWPKADSREPKAVFPG